MRIVGVIGLFVFCLAFSINAQQIRAIIPQVDYIHEEYNALVFPGSQELSSAFFEKMAKLMVFGEGQINAVHFGGSHIQADIYSNRMRQQLGAYLPNQQGARGLLFPFKIAKTNGPYDYSVHYTGTWSSVRNVSKSLDTKLGASGISVYTNDTTATVQFVFDRVRNLPHSFTRVKILHESDSLAYGLKWLGSDSLAVIYDYPSEGYSIIELSKPTDTLEFGLQKTDSLQQQFILYGLIAQNDEPGITYHSIGVNGASTYSYLRCELFEKHIEQLRPDIVFFGIGINDAHGANFTQAEYERNYDNIIAQIKRSNPSTFFVFITNNDSYGYNKKLNTNALIVQQALYNLAKRHNGAVWDLFAVMGGLKSANIWNARGMLRDDRIHFSMQGYNLVGDLLFNALMEAYDTYLLNRN